MTQHRSPDMDDVHSATRRAPGKAKVGRFVPIIWRDFTFEPEAEEYLVHGLLPRQGVAVFYGKPKTFKSFLALDLSVAIARRDRREWAGRATGQGVVVYICCEGAPGLRKRIEAYKRRTRELRDLDVYIIPARPELGTRPGDADDLIEAIRTALGAGEPVLVIIDTLARTLAGKDENGEGMVNFIDAAEKLSDVFHCLVVAVHHEGAGEKGRMRGYTAADGAMVVIWHVKKTSNGALGCTVTIQDAKDSMSGESLYVTLKKFELGDEHDPNRHTTLIVDSVEISAAADHSTTSAKKKVVGMTPAHSAFMTSIEIALHRFGIEVQLPNNGPKVKAVRIDQVRPTYYEKRADLDNQDSKITAFKRQLEAIIDRELLCSGTINGQAMLWRP